MGDHVGYRFHPTDVEIITYFLERKLRGLDFPVHSIHEVNLCNFEPWELPDFSAYASDEEWHFFVAPSYLNATSKLVNRKTRAGFWKPTGKPRNIIDKRGKEVIVIGFKRTLVFHQGRSPNAVRTPWVIHEYHSNIPSQYQNDFVLCRLKRKSDHTCTTRDQPTRHVDIPSNSGNDAAETSVTQENLSLHQNLQLFLEYNDLDRNSLSVLMSPEPRPSYSNAFNHDFNVSSPLNTSDEEDKFVKSLWADQDAEINSLEEIVAHGASFPIDTRTFRDQHVRVEQAQAQSGPTILQWQSKAVSRVEAREVLEDGNDLPRKENSIVKFGKDKKIAKQMEPQVNPVVKARLELQSDGSSGYNRKGSFIVMETPPLSHKLNPPSVYIRNAVVGIFLFIFFVGEMVYLH